jgi:hypothetical protein
VAVTGRAPRGLQINADTRAEPIARFLTFIDWSGGASSVRVVRTGRDWVFWSVDGTERFGSTVFYCSERPVTRREREAGGRATRE